MLIRRMRWLRWSKGGFPSSKSATDWALNTSLVGWVAKASRSRSGSGQSGLFAAAYQAPSFAPNHQTSPTAAVFCSFFSNPSVSVKK